MTIQKNKELFGKWNNFKKFQEVLEYGSKNIFWDVENVDFCGLKMSMQTFLLKLALFAHSHNTFIYLFWNKCLYCVSNCALLRASNYHTGAILQFQEIAINSRKFESAFQEIYFWVVETLHSCTTLAEFTNTSVIMHGGLSVKILLAAHKSQAHYKFKIQNSDSPHIQRLDKWSDFQVGFKLCQGFKH